AEVVYGNRTFGSHSSFSFWYVMGNKAVTTAANMLYNCYLGDLETCFKLMPLELYRSLDVKSRGFGMEAEVTGKLLRRGVRRSVGMRPGAPARRRVGLSCQTAGVPGNRGPRPAHRCRLAGRRRGPPHVGRVDGQARDDGGAAGGRPGRTAHPRRDRPAADRRH